MCYQSNMDKKYNKFWLALGIILLTLILDQVIKIVVKTNMYYGQHIPVTNWFYIAFIENNGMAFGMQVMPKAVQTLMRLVFSGFILWYIWLLVKARFKTGYIVCISLIFAGAVGNVIDSIFYGAIFSQSTPMDIATFVPAGQGYADWLYGRVVDMFYFPLFGRRGCLLWAGSISFSSVPSSTWPMRPSAAVPLPCCCSTRIRSARVLRCSRRKIDFFSLFL